MTIRDDAWTVTFYRVCDAATQRTVLEAVKALGRPGLRALGSQTQEGFLVAVESDSPAERFRGQHVVRRIDRHAREVDHARPRVRPGRGGAPAPWVGDLDLDPVTG